MWSELSQAINEMRLDLQRKEVKQSLYASQCKGGEGVPRELHALAIIQLAQQ